MTHIKTARRYHEANIDWDGLKQAVQEKRDEQGIVPGKPGIVEFQRSNASAVEQRFFGESGLLQSRLMYGMANADVDLDTLIEDLQLSLQEAMTITS